MALEDFGGIGSDDGNGRSVMGGEVADGIEEDEAGEVGELACDLVRLSREGGGPWDEGGGGFHALLRPVDMRWALG